MAEVTGQAVGYTPRYVSTSDGGRIGASTRDEATAGLLRDLENAEIIGTNSLEEGLEVYLRLPNQADGKPGQLIRAEVAQTENQWGSYPEGLNERFKAEFFVSTGPMDASQVLGIEFSSWQGETALFLEDGSRHHDGQITGIYKGAYTPAHSSADFSSAGYNLNLTEVIDPLDGSESSFYRLVGDTLYGNEGFIQRVYDFHSTQGNSELN